MKVFVKTLKGTRFEIEVNLEDTVADVKKHIETVQGSDVYPAALQMLIHNGKMLKDGTTLQENEVSENSSMVIMLSKNKSSSAPPPTQVAAPPPPPTSTTTHPPSNNVYNQAASHRAAFNNPERSVEYLYSGIPDSPDLPPVARAPSPPPVNPPQAAQPPPPPTGPNANPLNLFPQATQPPPPAPPIGPNANPLNLLPQATQPPPPPPPPAPPIGPNANPLNLFPPGVPAGGNLAFLRDSLQFQAFRSLVRTDPFFLEFILQQWERRSPEHRRLVPEYRDEFIRMIFDPVPLRWEIESLSITQEDMDAIHRLEAMGFDNTLVWEVYYACHKNEEVAANYLVDHMHDSDSDSDSEEE